MEIDTSDQTTQWQKILHKVVPAVVSLKMCTVRAFDTERPGFSQATGFIVDKEKGLILTNRQHLQNMLFLILKIGMLRALVQLMLKPYSLITRKSTYTLFIEIQFMILDFIDLIQKM